MRNRTAGGGPAAPAPYRPRRRQGHLRLEDYAAIGDGATLALAGADGSIDWWCVPAIDGEPLFDRLLDAPAGGYFLVRPRGRFTVDRSYGENSNLLVSDFTTPDGRARMTEAMALGDGEGPPPTELIRRIEGLEGRVEFLVEVRPSRAAAIPWNLEAGPKLSLSPGRDRRLAGRFAVGPGDVQTLSLTASHATPRPRGTPADRLDAADRAWRAWAGALTVQGRYAGLLRRHALALKLLMAPSGALVAAGTTSLPEIMGGERNWDFRFVWVRDAAYAIDAFIDVGALDDAERAFRWLMARLAEHGPRVVFDVAGAVAPTDRELDLPGYRGSRPLHVGNLATLQRQHGVFGDSLYAALRLAEAGRPPNAEAGAVLADLAERCRRAWREPDSGIWELSELRPYVNSRISAWQALDCAVRLADGGWLPDQARDRWARERDRIAAWIEENGWSDERQAYVSWPGSDAVDAGLTLAARFGYGPPARIEATLRAIDGALRAGPFHHRMSGVSETEGCFLACSLWLCEAKARLGRREEAIAEFEALLAAIGGIGVLPEMAEPGTGRWLGNMPQGLTHLAIIQAATLLGKS
jgi:GH15 family glucan-1,4-alpha-glucosidase